MCAAWLSLAPLPAHPASLQKKDEPEDVPEVDPYTEADPERMAAAGYVRFGPLPWGDDHDTGEILRVLGDIPLLWVETEHLKIGSSLPKFTLAEDQIERRKIKAELKALKDALKGVRGNERELDRWLVLHLYAARLERIYVEFCERFGLPLEVPPELLARGGDDPTSDAPAEVLGPYLGQREKPRILLFEKESGLARYTGHFLGNETTYGRRGSFMKIGAMYYVVSREMMHGDYDNDTAFNSIVAAGLTHALADGLADFKYPVPPWLVEGLGHSAARAVDPRFPVDGIGWDPRGSDDWYRWEPRVFGRVKHDYYPSWEEMLGWPMREDMEHPDHMIAWSRVEYLARDPEVLLTLTLAIKSTQDFGKQATVEEQRAAIEGATGKSLDELDADWAQHVTRKYARK